MIRQRIAEAVRAAVGDVPFVVERPRAATHGDYSTNAALVAKLDPQELAAKLVGIDGVERVEVAGKFVNFFLTREALVPQQQKLPQFNAGKTILVEYTSPNLFKPLHIGNLIGNILGEAIARLLERTGAKVKRINYPSDIGLTVAKGVWGLRKLAGDPTDIKQLGEAYVAGNAAYEDGSAKDEIEAINKALYENSDAELSRLRAEGIETSRKHLDELCAKLGTTFDTEFFESQSGPIGAELVRTHIGDVFEESDGAVVYKGPHTRVFLNSRGLPTYEAKEVGLFELKSTYCPDFDLSITVTGNEQSGFFAVVFDAIAKLFPERTAGKTLRHIANGFLKLTTGKMSSRLGNVITGESLIVDLTKAARDREDVAVGAIKYSVLKSGNGKDIVFDPEKSLSLEGDSGPYIQYARVRAASLLGKSAQEVEVLPAAASEPEGMSSIELARVLIHFPEVVERAAKELEPHHLTTYITEVAAAFNSWYGGERLIVDGQILKSNAELVRAVERTLREGLEALGIPVPEEM